MRSIVTLLLLAPALLLAAGNTPSTVLPADDGSNLPPNPYAGAGPTRQARFTIGTVDTIGGTTYDWGANGAALRMLVRSPGLGVHALWMYSNDYTNTAFPDRNMRYNYYDLNSHSWMFVDPDFMLSGVNSFSYRTGYGNLQADSTGAAVISAHYTAASTHITPTVARDAAPGAGIFDYAPGDPTIEAYEWPWIAIGANNYFHLAMIEEASQNTLFYSRLTSWPNWENAVSVPSPQPEPNFPDHNVAASNTAGSQKAVITWVASPDAGYQQDPGFYRETPDGGATWSEPVDIGWPPAFTPGSESVPSWHITSLFPFYDKLDRLHIVGNVSPYVRDTNWILPGQVWHWCADNPDTWNLIHVASPESLNAAVGYNVMICARPSLGEDDWGNLFVAWEEFDGVNVEQTTSRVRADIWYSSSTDNGVTWADGTKITDGGEVSYRFPCMMSSIGDTVMVEYLIDQVAGFFLYAEGPATANPIVVQKWPNPFAPGVQGPNTVRPGRMDIVATPNPFGASLRVSYAVPHRGNAAVEIFDASGRLVKTLFRGRSEPGRHSAAWDGRSTSGSVLPNGIYLYRYSLDGRQLTGKVTLSR